MRAITVAISVFLITTAWSAVLSAQSGPPDHIVRQYYRAASRTINVVISKIRPTLSSSERRILRNIDIGVNQRDWNIYGVFGSQEGVRSKIQFSIGFIIAIDYIDTAVAASELMEISPSKLINYVNSVVEAIRRTIRQGRRGKDPTILPTFNRAMGISDDRWKSLVRSQKFVAHKELIKLHSFALILGHELAHHFEGHMNNKRASTKDESEADDRGIQIALDADYNPLLAWTPFWFFAAMEGYQGIYDRSSTHPPPACRMVKALEAGFENALGDKDFIRYLRRTGQYRAWISKVNQLQELARSGQVDCP